MHLLALWRSQNGPMGPHQLLWKKVLLMYNPRNPQFKLPHVSERQKSLCIGLTAPSCYQECILILSASTLFQYFVSSGYDGFSHCSRVQFTPNHCLRVEFTPNHNGGLRFLCPCDTEDEAFKMTSWQSFLTTPCMRPYGRE